MQKSKGTISEKSFYTYFKNTPKKLPRVDILNLLTTYTGEASWPSFCNKNQIKKEKKKTSSLYKYALIAIAILSLSFIITSLLQKENSFSFCFIDADRGTEIRTIPLDIIVLNNEESPRYYKSDSLGCFTWSTTDSYIHFVVQSPYHKTDTIKRYSDVSTTEDVRLLTDDYSLMLYYYANNNIKDWKKRKQQLNDLIAENAILIQVLPHDLGVEIFSKQDFIEKLTTPTKSLKNFEIIESQKQQNKIVKLKFKTRYE
ncbi:hypothetical protein [Dokdonia sp.]|uniref:hypothetical protein n=1 Tax=Dokdonia sp. TaxID=2024995 RepID=UPI0032634CB4